MFNVNDLDDAQYQLLTRMEGRGESHASICSALRRIGTPDHLLPPAPPSRVTTPHVALIKTSDMSPEEWEAWKADPVNGERRILERRQLAARVEEERAAKVLADEERRTAPQSLNARDLSPEEWSAWKRSFGGNAA
jgi:hypothetical protein